MMNTSETEVQWDRVMVALELMILSYVLNDPKSEGSWSRERVEFARSSRPADFPVVGSPRFTIGDKSTQDTFIAVDNANNIVYVVSRGTTLGKDFIRDLVASDVVGFTVGYSRRVDTTMKFAERAFEIARENNGTVQFCGHSLGGAIAKTCGILTGCKYIAFNAPDMALIPNYSRLSWFYDNDNRPSSFTAHLFRTFVDTLYPHNAPIRRYTRKEYDEGVKKMHREQGLEMRNHKDYISGPAAWVSGAASWWLNSGGGESASQRAKGTVVALIFDDCLDDSHSASEQLAALAHRYHGAAREQSVPKRHLASADNCGDNLPQRTISEQYDSGV